MTITEYLKQNNKEQKELAKTLGISTSYMNAIIKGKRPITDDMFDKLIKYDPTFLDMVKCVKIECYYNFI